jgi:pimeloyl-ACP methyl ester carboxylesterase
MKMARNKIQYNFLRTKLIVAGTHHLVEDIFMFMGVIGAPSLSLYGISYGTTVMATFATIFPSYVDKFVIDSNV